MYNPKRLPLLFLYLTGACFSLLLCPGCITISADAYRSSVAYEPVQSPLQIDVSAVVTAEDTLSQEMRDTWKRWMNNDQTISNYLTAVGQTIQKDLATSGLFARVLPDASARPDYLVHAVCLESHPSDYRIRVTLTATEASTGTPVSSHAKEHSFGTSMFGFKMKEALPPLMAALKADLAADLQTRIRAKQEQTAREQSELLNKASLADLLAAADRNVTTARTRNRAIVAAKTLQLPGILRDWKTDQLTGLVVKIEQTILDLNHESEVAKDAAQQALAGDAEASGRPARGMPAAGGSGPDVDDLRNLSICYRERIELLKPIAAALKEEIANRGR